MSYVLKRTDQGGGFVSKPGSKNSYTNNILRAKIFRTRDDAEQDRCIGNEIIINTDELIKPS